MYRSLLSLLPLVAAQPELAEVIGSVLANASNQDEGVLSQCKKASYGFCCEVGTPCDCTKGVTASGQCKPESYGFCCSIGTPCDCSQPPLAGHKDIAAAMMPLAAALPLPVEKLVEKPVAFPEEKPVEKPLAQCKKTSYAFCCEVGTPCDCTKGTTASGQCRPESYGFCCSIGAPCDCSLPPLEEDVNGTSSDNDNIVV
eukprot:TRINITY_DN94439_c0_g1_i1.p2 TRINITY_DN94439_c0_g1~~TRINITY_DN94439_c0_g1_i1.p2  ORF type:complete len:227 (+),score=61.60 TRINITY_DN94439_c0_g1_i1:85-681(+)